MKINKNKERNYSSHQSIFVIEVLATTTTTTKRKVVNNFY